MTPPRRDLRARCAARGERALVAYFTAGDPSLADDRAPGGRGGAPRRRRHRAGRAVLRPARRRPGDPARRRSARSPPAPRCRACSRWSRELRARGRGAARVPHLLQPDPRLRPQGLLPDRGRGRRRRRDRAPTCRPRRRSRCAPRRSRPASTSIHFVAPTSHAGADAARSRGAAAASSTWSRSPGSPASARELPARPRRRSSARCALVTTKPICVGFGISHARAGGRGRAALADGVIVGSAIVRLVEQHAGIAGARRRGRRLHRLPQGAAAGDARCRRLPRIAAPPGRAAECGGHSAPADRADPMAGWFRRQTAEGEQGERPKKVVIAEGLWIKCDSCKEIIYRAEVERAGRVCPKCHYPVPHLRARAHRAAGRRRLLRGARRGPALARSARLQGHQAVPRPR